MIPNILHFIHLGGEFVFINYLAVLSAKVVHHPDKIFLHYNKEPGGSHWEKVKLLATLKYQKIPEYIGNKKINYIQHKADILRIMILNATGGIYFDTDVISVHPYHHFLNYTTAIPVQQDSRALCNAVIFSQPNSEFLKLWYERYEHHFNPNGWEEANVLLPMQLAKQYPGLITILPKNAFYKYLWTELDKIFTAYTDRIPQDIIGLHLWHKVSSKYLSEINGYEWAHLNRNTLLGKAILMIEEIAAREKLKTEEIMTRKTGDMVQKGTQKAISETRQYNKNDKKYADAVDVKPGLVVMLTSHPWVLYLATVVIITLIFLRRKAF